MLNNDKVIDKLNHLLGTVIDGEKGYREAAGEIETSSLKTLFHRYAQQRAGLSAELQSQIRELGGEPDDNGSAVAAMHRVWINIREAISTRDDYAVVAEAERGEDVAISNYQSVMEEDLPANIKVLLTEQYGKVKSAHGDIVSLKQSLSS